MNIKSKEFWDPRVKRGIRWWHYSTITTIIVAVVVAFILSVVTVATYKELSAYYFKHHYQAPLRVPTKHVKVSPVSVSTIEPKFLVNFQYLPYITNQDGLGACQAVTEYNYQFPYLYNTHFNRTWSGSNKPIRFSSRYVYDTVTNGIDAGSYADQDANVLTQGVPFWRYFPYGSAITSLYPGYAQYGDEPIGAIPFAVDQQLQKFSLVTHTAFDYPGAGYGGVALLKSYMTQYKSTGNLDLPVFPEFDAATQHNGKIGLPTNQETDRGGHAVTILGWDDTILVQNGDGSWSKGGFYIANQWTAGWGATINLQPTNGNNGGYGFISYDFVAKYGWGAKVYQINWPKPPASMINPGTYKNPHPLPILPPPPGVSHKIPKVTAGTWYVSGVYTNDLGSGNFDLAPYLNAQGDLHGVSPVGLAATLGGECGLRTGNANFSYLNDDCSRYGVWPDVSFGACQVTVQTAGQFGYGDGTYTQGNTNYIHFNLENHPTTCVQMEGTVMGSDANITHLPYPYLMVAWNCGPGWSTYQLENPYSISTQCGDNFQNYIGWYNYALEHWASLTPPPVPQSFNLKVWNQYRKEHKLGLISPYYGKNFSLFANAFQKKQSIGGVVNQYTYFKQGFAKERFQGATVYVWPKHSNYKAKYVRAKWLK